MPPLRLTLLALLLLPTLALAQLTPSPPTTAPVRTSPPAPRDTAYAWYRTTFSNPDDDRLAALYRAHLLVEEYFSPALPGPRRKQIVTELDKLPVSPDDVARLCYLRLSWQPVDTSAGPAVFYINDRVGPVPVHYFVGVPKGYTPGTPTPVVLMLPTATAFVVKRDWTGDEVARVYTDWIKAELAKPGREGYLVVMPLLHLTDLWGPGYAGMNNAMKPLQDLAERFSIDPRRVYLRGQGMSGHAVWNLGLHYPTYFAAINPLAGAASYDFQRMRLINLRNTLSVVWHDADDKAVPVKSSRELVNTLRKNKIDVVYEETKKTGHTPGPDIEQRLFSLLTARTRDLYPKSISLRTNRPDVAFNRVDWLQVWQPLDPGDDVRMIFRWSGTGMWSYSNPVTVDATYADNRFTLTTRNLGAARLLLSKDMYDPARAVSVWVNKKCVYEGHPVPTIEATLTDQLALGRGWRDFTTAITIDLLPPPTTAPTSRPTTTTRPN